jgi:hypothetical protein
MSRRLVYVPVDLPDGVDGPAVVRDADGCPRRVRLGPLTAVEDRLCLTAAHLGELRGRHRVRLPDGTECWADPPPDLWVYQPEAAGPAAPASV